MQHGAADRAFWPVRPSVLEGQRPRRLALPGERRGRWRRAIAVGVALAVIGVAVGVAELVVRVGGK